MDFDRPAVDGEGQISKTVCLRHASAVKPVASNIAALAQL
jgi:hypothetical protein